MEELEYKRHEIEWTVLRNGYLWSDFLSSEEECEEVINYSMTEYIGEREEYKYKLVEEDERAKLIPYSRVSEIRERK